MTGPLPGEDVLRRSLALVFPVYSARIIQRRMEAAPGYVLVRLSRNFCHQLAITAGIAKVETDAAVIMDSDLQYPLEVVEEMITKWREGYDVVYGVRARREGEPFFKLATAAVFYRFFRWMTDLDMPLDAGDFRLISRPVTDVFNRIEDSQPFVRGLITWLGFRQTGVEYVRAPRVGGTSKYRLGKMARLALNGLTSFSDKPLRITVRFGAWTAILSLAALTVYLIAALFSAKSMSIITVLAFTVFFFGGVQLLVFGIIGTYLIRVYSEVKGRPRYIVESVWRSGR